MTVFRLYTDGSCPAPGAAGGWAWILVGEDVVDSRSGGIPAPSTHQRAEVIAAIEGLSYLVASRVREVELLSDSRHVVGGLSSTGCKGCKDWAHAAAQRNWRSKDGRPLKNRDLRERLLELDRSLVVAYRHVPGHRPKVTRAMTPATTARSMRWRWKHVGASSCQASKRVHEPARMGERIVA